MINIAMFESKLFKFNNYLIRVTGFPQMSFGHLCLDFNMALQLSKREGSLSYFLKQMVEVNSAVLSLKCNDVFIIQDKDLPKNANFYQLDLGQPTWPYYKRTLIREPLSFDFPEDAMDDMQRRLSLLNINLSQKIVTLHVREEGWYGYIGHGCASWDTNEWPANVNIRNYAKAIEYLTSLGYLVIRIGKNQHTLIEGDNVVDLANSPYRTDMLELYLINKSHFLIASDSGVRQVGELFGVPFLTVNATDPFGCYPIQVKCLYILKKVIDKETGYTLTLRDMLSAYYHDYYRDTKKWKWIDNSEDEILEAVQEMLLYLQGDYKISAEQIKYKEEVIRASKILSAGRLYVQKWGADGDFIGDGWIADSYIQKHKDAL